MPGTELVNHTVGINPTLVYKRLEPRILDNKEHARKIAIEEYVNLEKEKSLELLCDITKQIYQLDKHISHLIHESDVKKDSQRQIAYKLECLGISAEKIAIATQQKDLPYMLTEDQECEEVRADRKRKFEEEAKEEERKRQRRETIVMKDGKIISGGDKSQEVKDATHNTTLTTQQQRIMKDQESLIQRQDTQLIQLNLRIKALEAEKAEMIAKQQQQDQQLQQQQQQEQPPLPTIPSLSNIAGLPLLDDDVIEFTDLTAGARQTLLTPVIPPFIPPAIPTVLPPAQPGTSSQSTESSNPFNIKRAIRPEHLKFLPKYASAGLKKEPQSTAEIVDQSNVEVLNLPPEGSSNIIFVPKKIDQKKALVLVPQTRKRFLNKQNNPGAPVPEDAQDPTRFYCPNCACNYKEKGDLQKHLNFNCMKTSFDYICDACQKEFLTNYGVREHYYQEHKKQFLYFCPKCNKGFYHKSHKSNHKKSCPNKDGEDKYTTRAPYELELELTFKRRQRVEIPPQVAEIALQQQESDKAAELLEELEQQRAEEAQNTAGEAQKITGMEFDLGGGGVVRMT